MCASASTRCLYTCSYTLPHSQPHSQPPIACVGARAPADCAQACSCGNWLAFSQCVCSVRTEVDDDGLVRVSPPVWPAQVYALKMMYSFGMCSHGGGPCTVLLLRACLQCVGCLGRGVPRPSAPRLASPTAHRRGLDGERCPDLVAYSRCVCCGLPVCPRTHGRPVRLG